jgi:hypothetical protein
MELIGLYIIACLLLVAAGVAKAVRPDDTARALASTVHAPVRYVRALVRMGSIVEVVVGLIALLVPRPWSAGLVAVSYVAFASFVIYARSTDGAVASCGCFGTPDTPATLVHAIINAALALSAGVVAWSAPPSDTIVGILSHQPGQGIALVAVSTLGAWLVYLSISVLARLQAARSLTGVTFDRGADRP